MKKTTLILLLGLLFNMTFAQSKLPKDTPKTKTYSSLLQLCKELRLLERTSLPSGVPDYRSQTILKIQQTLGQYKAHHANMINYEQARKFQVEWTPKGWTGDESLVGFEQHLYLRQPGYGTSYVTGKYFIEKLMMDMSRLQQNNFTLYSFFEKFYNAGIIPISLVGWQMTGNDDEIKKLLKK